MSNVPGAEDSAQDGVKDAASAALANLRAEFPGWEIRTGPGDPRWRATRDGGHGGAMTVGASSYGGLREALDEVDAVDCKHATYALRDALRARGLKAEAMQLTVATKTRTGIVRTVNARRGRYWWASGIELAPIGDPEQAADRMLPGLGLS